MIQLKDGRMFDPVTKKVMVSEEDKVSLPELISFEPQPKAGMRLEDLPADYKKMNVICAILGYRLLGMTDTDICFALGCDQEILLNIVETEAYESSYKIIIDSFVAGQNKAARDVLQRSSITAAQTVVHVMKNSKNEQNKLKAAEGILNRTGVSEDSNNNSMGAGLMIKIVKDADVSSLEIKIGG